MILSWVIIKLYKSNQLFCTYIRRKSSTFKILIYIFIQYNKMPVTNLKKGNKNNLNIYEENWNTYHILN